MTVDFTKFPFPTIVHPDVATLTEAITTDPVDSGFVIITLKAAEPAALQPVIREFAMALRADGADAGLVEITAYRQLQRNELGGAIPFDQPICESIIAAAARGAGAAGIGAQAMATVVDNPRADVILLLEYTTPEIASRTAKGFADGENGLFAHLAAAAKEHTIGAFKNMRRYSSVSRDPNVIQFFNLFGAPGDLDVLWSAWQEALPWFFETAEFRSSFPLLALDPQQEILLVNYAHVDSTKHFLNGALHDPAFAQSMATNYVQRNVTLPTPFFCKIVPI
jgi:hypothetical protein